MDRYKVSRGTDPEAAPRAYPVGWFSDEWIMRFLRVAVEVASWSKDPSTKVGAVIANPQRRIVSTGYNGFPPGIRDSDSRLDNRDIKNRYILHAEVNAILNCDCSLVGCLLFTTFPPCAEICAPMIAGSGIRGVHSIEPSPEKLARWGDSFQKAHDLFDMAGIAQSSWTISRIYRTREIF